MSTTTPQASLDCSWPTNPACSARSSQSCSDQGYKRMTSATKTLNVTRSKRQGCPIVLEPKALDMCVSGNSLRLCCGGDLLDAHVAGSISSKLPEHFEIQHCPKPPSSRKMATIERLDFLTLQPTRECYAEDREAVQTEPCYLAASSLLGHSLTVKWCRKAACSAFRIAYDQSFGRVR